MNRLRLNYTLVLIAISFFFGRMAFAETVKTHREDFSQLIEDGVKNEQQLQKALQKSVGTDRVNANDVKTKERRMVMVRLHNDNVVVPSSPAPRAKKARPLNYNDLTQKRISQEVESLEP
jgi:hypothetical protein